MRLTTQHCALALGLVFSGIALGETADLSPSASESEGIPKADQHSTRSSRQWTLALDNDLFSSGATDRDYSAGLRLTTWRDNDESTQAGLLLYTPDDLFSSAPQADDRPYANLLYLARSYDHLADDGQRLTRHTYSIGLIGTSLGELVQRGAHSLLDAEEPNGYDNQISDGGELTARFGWSQFRPLSKGTLGRGHYSLLSETAVSLGYLTETSYGLGLRVSARPHWWADGVNDFQTQLDEPIRISAAPNYWYAGIRLRARGYNSLIQGQVRDSNVTFAANQLNPVIGEAWVGLSRRWRGWQLTYSLAYQSAEIKSQFGGRSQVYGSLSFARSK